MSSPQNLTDPDAAVQALFKQRNDRWYPQFHIAAKAGWINDPNGLTYFNGNYQVYFQHHPHNANWGTMHWGHVSSPDMVTWQHEPVALTPSLDEDRDGVFSGSAVTSPEGSLFAYYTGHRWNNGVDDGDGNLQVQCLATSTDGKSFHKEGMIIDCPEGVKHFRDPKVWEIDDRWFMVFGVCSGDNRGEVWLYTSDDMRRWVFDSVVYRDRDPQVFMLECPDMFPLGDKWVITYCPMGKQPQGYEARNGHNAGYVVGNWTPGEAFEVVTPYTTGDWGHQYYAPQSFLDPQGRRITYAWMGSFTTEIPSQLTDCWAGQLTIPRVLTLDEQNHVCAAPLPELRSLRRRSRDFGSFDLEANRDLVLFDDVDTAEIEIEVDLGQTSAERFGFLVHKTDDGNCLFVGYDDLANQVIVDRRGARYGDRGYRAAPVDSATTSLRLQIFIDRGSVEVFVGEGAQTLSSFSFPGPGPRRVELSSELGSSAIIRLRVHELGTIWRDESEDCRQSLDRECVKSCSSPISPR